MSRLTTVDHLIEGIKAHGFPVTPQTEDELRSILDLREQALAGALVDSTPAVFVLQKAFDDRSMESHAALYPLAKQGMFGLGDWQALYLPYLQQLADLLNQQERNQPQLAFPGATSLPPFLQGCDARYVLTRLAHNYHIKRGRIVGAPEEIM